MAFDFWSEGGWLRSLCGDEAATGRGEPPVFSAPACRAGELPPVNVYANEEGVAIAALLPDVRAEELELSTFRDTLTLRGKLDAEAADERAYHRRERGDGEFVRNIFLPFRVDADRVEASAQNGVLRISLYRPEEDRPKRIRISG